MSAEPTKESRHVAERYTRLFKPKPDVPIYTWAGSSGIKLDATSPIAGPYRVENSEWLREQFHAFKDEDTRMVTSVGPNQGGRTKAMEVASLWAIENRPGPTQWNSFKDDKARAFAEKRWWPMAKSCRPIVEKLMDGGTGLGQERHKTRLTSVMFKDGMPFNIQGCAPGNLQEDSIKTQFNDECFQWPIGRLEDAWIRCNVAYAWNYKVWNGSVAGIAGDDLELAFKSGTMEEWHWHCLNPKCKKKQIPKWGGKNDKGGIKWKVVTNPDGSYNFPAIAKTVRYECEHCGAVFADNRQTRIALNKHARYYRTNPNADDTHRSFRFNILTVNWPGLNWSTWVEEFLNATEAYRRYHNTEKLKLFWTRRMADFWEENKFLGSGRRIVISDYKLGEPNLYIEQQWEKEIARFMGVDKQESKYFAVIRAASPSGESRLVWRGELGSYGDIDDKAREYGVPSSNVLIDFGFEMTEVATQAAHYGWTGMLGDDKDEGYRHSIEIPDPRARGQKKVIKLELPYSEAKYKDPMIGTEQQVANTRMRQAARKRVMARYFMWSNLGIKDILNGFKQGRAIYWGIPEDVGAEYIKQLSAEVRHRIVSAKGKITNWWSNTNAKGTGTRRANHYWDCECMILTAMCMQQLIDLRGNWTPEGGASVIVNDKDMIAMREQDSEKAAA